jgi:dipeptide/tripeptide permease
MKRMHVEDHDKVIYYLVQFLDAKIFWLFFSSMLSHITLNEEDAHGEP